MAKNDNILTAALDYLTRGWSIIPVKPGQKKPNVKSWTKYRENPADEAQIRKWFSGSLNNIGVICGPVSGGLTVIDFDKEELYHDWAAKNPELSAKLPTVKTGRGYHVYIRTDWTKTKHFADVDIISNGYVTAPPSKHEKGTVYHWINPLNGELTAFDAQDVFYSGLKTDRDSAQVSTNAQVGIGVYKDVQVGTGSKGCVKGFVFIPEIVEAIEVSTPQWFGQRNTKLFELARRIAGLLPNADNRALDAIFRRWWSGALPNIRDNDFWLNHAKFIKDFKTVKVPFGAKPMEVLKEKIGNGHVECPAGVLECFDYFPPPEQRQIGLLAGCCKELSDFHAPDPFFLSERDAGKLIGGNEHQGRAFLKLLVSDGFLELVEIGGWRTNEQGKHEKKATTYRYIGSDSKIIDDKT